MCYKGGRRRAALSVWRSAKDQLMYDESLPSVLQSAIPGLACEMRGEMKPQPPFWLHAALWLPLILATTLLPLRSMKALLIALQFHQKAAEGREVRVSGGGVF